LATFFLIGLVAAFIAPQPTSVILFAAIPVSIILAAISTAYLTWVFRRQPSPRSRFLRMLVETFYALLAVGVWVGYLTLARLSERAASAGLIDWTLPAPAPTVAAPISALVVIVVFAAPVRFAWEVYRLRGASDADETRADARDSMDREE
jgi:hypothetical protein